MHFKVHDFDDAYANGPNIPGGERWPEAWVKPAADFRTTHRRVLLDTPYGEHQREQYDMFLPDHPAKGVFVFVHGGFWVRLDKSYWSHLAAGAVGHGYAVVMPSYPLCPEVRVTDICHSIAKAIDHATPGISGPIILSGHSAGGQIVTRLVAEGTTLSEATLARVSEVLSISGVHDLRPLISTAMNDKIGLDWPEAMAESPALLRPLIAPRLTCWVGGNERAEFIRQNDLLANIWRGLGLETAAITEPDRHHFNIIDGLADAQSPLMRAVFA